MLKILIVPKSLDRFRYTESQKIEHCWIRQKFMPAPLVEMAFSRNYAKMPKRSVTHSIKNPFICELFPIVLALFTFATLWCTTPRFGRFRMGKIRQRRSRIEVNRKRRPHQRIWRCSYFSATCLWWREARW